MEHTHQHFMAPAKAHCFGFRPSQGDLLGQVLASTMNLGHNHSQMPPPSCSHPPYMVRVLTVFFCTQFSLERFSILPGIQFLSGFQLFSANAHGSSYYSSSPDADADHTSLVWKIIVCSNINILNTWVYVFRIQWWSQTWGLRTLRQITSPILWLQILARFTAAVRCVQKASTKTFR